MSLTAKIAASLTALVLSVAVGRSVLRHRSFEGAFTPIERSIAAENVEQVARAVQVEVDDLERIARRYAAWNRAYDFLVSSHLRAGFIRDNINSAALRSQDLDLLYFCELDGTVAGGLSLDATSNRTARLRQFPPTALPEGHPALAAIGTKTSVTPTTVSGLLPTEHGLLLIAASKVSGLDPRARGRGVVITGRFLDGEVRERVERRTNLECSLWALAGPDLPDGVSEVMERLEGASEPAVLPGDDARVLFAYTKIDDLRGRPALLLRSSADRPITAAAAHIRDRAVVTEVALGIALLLGLLIAFYAIVVRSVRNLSKRAQLALEADTLGEPLGSGRRDELGALARTLDELFVHLDQARTSLVETSRTAGLSEIATGILHNVGNVLNSVNISASLVSQRVDGLCIDDLERLAQVLAENAHDLPAFLSSDPRGQHIQPFLSALVVQLGEEQQTIRSEVESLANGIDHICELVKSQQDMAKGARAIEVTNLPERFDEALRITQRVHGIDPNLVVTRRYEEIPEIELDKHKLLEILVNLVQNARQAMAGIEGERELALEVRPVDDDRIVLVVEDSGMGIAEGDLERVFSMGFTTREEGHGFGLHASANAALEMGGRLYVESDGPGEGARFLLELPLIPPVELAAAPDDDGGTASAEEGGQ